MPRQLPKGILWDEYTCPRCKIKKSKNEYWKNKYRYNGLDTYCKECRKSLDPIYDEAARQDKKRAEKLDRELAKVWHDPDDWDNL